MKYLILGQGGREHAIVRALKQAPSVSEIHVAPGSFGISQDAICHAVDLGDPAAMAILVQRYRFDCVVIGPSELLGGGIADRIRDLGINVVGPGQGAAQLGSNSAFARAFAQRAGVSMLEPDRDEVIARLHYLVLTNGEEFQALPPARGVSEATGHELKLSGTSECLGVVAPAELLPTGRAILEQKIVEPTLRQLTRDQLLYRGVLRFNVAITREGPKLEGYGVCFGEVDAQVLLPLLEGDWGAVFKCLSLGEVLPLRWSMMQAACLIEAAPGYPERTVTGGVIDGDLGFQTASSYFLHAGTARTPSGQWVVGGGRVLDAIGFGHTPDEALAAAHTQARSVSWPGLQMRSNVGRA